MSKWSMTINGQKLVLCHDSRGLAKPVVAAAPHGTRRGMSGHMSVHALKGGILDPWDWRLFGFFKQLMVVVKKHPMFVEVWEFGSWPATPGRYFALCRFWHNYISYKNNLNRCKQRWAINRIPPNTCSTTLRTTCHDHMVRVMGNILHHLIWWIHVL